MKDLVVYLLGDFKIRFDVLFIIYYCIYFMNNCIFKIFKVYLVYNDFI